MLKQVIQNVHDWNYKLKTIGAKVDESKKVVS